MTDRFNTIAGWFLFSGIVALGLSIVSGMYFGADKHHAPHTVGYPIQGEAAEGEGSGPSLAELLATADPVKGEALFAKCQSCHTIDQGGANGIGPNLFGVMGEAIATGHGGFAFSDALKSKGGEWTFENMDHWLKSPRGFADGTKMSFAGIADGQERANVIVFLNSKGANLPLPAVEAKPAAADEAATGEEAAGEEAAAEEVAVDEGTPPAE
jgi:cytochrome c